MAFATSHNLSVSIVDNLKNPLIGYWVEVTQNGVLVVSGFSTAEFTLAPGDYNVAVGDYGGQFFNQWSDGTTTREISITITSTNTVSLTANYSTSPPGPIGGPSIEVDSVYFDGSALSGMFVQLSQGGVVVDQGFTPAVFSVTEGLSYDVAVGDFTGAFFNQWGSGDITRTITVIATDTTESVEAQYTQTPQPPIVTGSSIEVNSSYSGGAALSGIYVQISQNGAVVGTGFTPAVFEVTQGLSYVVSVGDYTGAFFNHWATGQITRTLTVTATASATQLEAIFTTTVQPAPPGEIGPNSVTVISEFLNGTATTLNLYVQIRVDGNVLTEGYTPVTFSNLDPEQEYFIVVYNDKDNWFRHYSDGTLLRYKAITPGPDPITLTAKYEQVPKTIDALLDITAIDQFGNILGDTTGSVEQGNIVVTPGMWVPITPPGQNTPYTGGFTGGSGFPFSGFIGQTYVFEMTSYQQYQFSHWEDSGSTDPVRAFTLNGNSLNNVAIYNVAQ